MLAPTDLRREDLDASPVSTYPRTSTSRRSSCRTWSSARSRRPARRRPSEAPDLRPPDDDDATNADDDERHQDFEMRFARQLVSSVSAANRLKLVGSRAPTSSSRRCAADEEKKLVAALGTIGVD